MTLLNDSAEMPKFRVSLFTIGICVMRASRALTPFVLFLLVTDYLRSEDQFDPSGYWFLIGCLAVVTHCIGFLLNWHVGRRRTTARGWNFSMYVHGGWVDLCDTGCFVSVRGRERRLLEYVNILADIWIRDLARLGSQEVEVVGTGRFGHLPLFHPPFQRERITRKILRARDMQPLTELAMWSLNGEHLRLDVVGDSGTYKNPRTIPAAPPGRTKPTRSDRASEPCEETFRYSLTVTGVHRLPVIYDPNHETRYASTHFASASNELYE